MTELDVGAIALVHPDKIKAVLLFSAKVVFKTRGVSSGCRLTEVFEIRHLLLRYCVRSVLLDASCCFFQSQIESQIPFFFWEGHI